MKILNNKGFAISTLLYGIIIMMFLIVIALMSTLGSTRKNTRNLVDVIDDELSRFGSINQEITYDNSIDTRYGRTYIVQSNGWYKIELWSSKNSLGSGPYISGIIYLETNTYLYIHLSMENTSPTSYINFQEDNSDYTIMRAPLCGYRSEGEICSDQYKYIMYGTAGSSSTGGYNTISQLDGKTPQFYDPVVVYGVNSGESKVKITKISDNDQSSIPINRKNTVLDNVRYIKDCVTGNSDSKENDYGRWSEIQAINSAGENVALNKNLSSSGGTEHDMLPGNNKITDGVVDNSYNWLRNPSNPDSEKCVTIDLGNTYKLNEIAVWHNYGDELRFYNHKISVGSYESSLKEIRHTSYTKNTYVDSSEIESSQGIRYSAFQHYPGQTENLSDGKYYIFYIGDKYKDKVLTQIDDSVSIKTFNATKNQQWNVMKNSDNTYRIVSAKSNDIIEKVEPSTIICKNKEANDNQNFIIYGSLNGYYTIKDNLNKYLYNNDYMFSLGSVVPASLQQAVYYNEWNRFKFIKIHE